MIELYCRVCVPASGVWDLLVFCFSICPFLEKGEKVEREFQTLDLFLLPLIIDNNFDNNFDNKPPILPL